MRARLDVSAHMDEIQHPRMQLPVEAQFQRPWYSKFENAHDLQLGAAAGGMLKFQAQAVRNGTEDQRSLRIPQAPLWDFLRAISTGHIMCNVSQF